MAEFKKEFYIKWQYSDWLNDANVRLLKPEHKGFWIDLICMMALFFPYGHCSKLDPKKLKKSKFADLINLKKFSVEDLVNQKSKGEVDFLVELQVRLSLEEQLSISENLEDKLHKYLPYSPDEVKYHIEAIEDEGVCSRTGSGIIYSRRLVRDFRKRITAFKNGSKGGNPDITGRTPKPKKRKSAGPENSSVESLVNQNPNYEVGSQDNHLSNYNYNYNKESINNKDTTDSESLKDGGLGETNFTSFADLAKCSEYVSVTGFSNNCTPEEFATWQKFVRTIQENKMDDIWIAKFINPNDFSEVVKKHSFTENKWLPVLRRLLSTGIKPEHNLYHRIPEFIGYVYRSQGNGNSGLNAGDGNYESQESWT